MGDNQMNEEEYEDMLLEESEELSDAEVTEAISFVNIINQMVKVQNPISHYRQCKHKQLAFLNKLFSYLIQMLIADVSDSTKEKRRKNECIQ